MSKTWYNLTTAQNSVSIDILDEIGVWGINASQFINEVKEAGDVSDINIAINSPGGSVFDGLAIYNYLKSHKAQVNVEVLGLAASAASVITMAGDTIRMPEDAFLMIHAPYTGVQGDAEEMRKTADVLDKIQESLVNIYVERTGMEYSAVAEMVEEETWLNGVTAMELGFADEVTDQAIAALAKGFEKNFKSVPQALTGKKIDISNISTIRDFEKVLRDSGLSRKDATALASKKVDIQRDIESKPEVDISAFNSLLDALASSQLK